jgi:hypothetical protein
MLKKCEKTQLFLAKQVQKSGIYPLVLQFAKVFVKTILGVKILLF